MPCPPMRQGVELTRELEAAYNPPEVDIILLKDVGGSSGQWKVRKEKTEATRCSGGSQSEKRNSRSLKGRVFRQLVNH